MEGNIIANEKKTSTVLDNNIKPIKVKFYTIPRKLVLRKNFHKIILELENELMRNKSLEIVNKLFQLYKVRLMIFKLIYCRFSYVFYFILGRR